MKTFSTTLLSLAFVPLAGLAAISYTDLGATLSENFNTDAEGGWAGGSFAWENGVTIPGWHATYFHGGNQTYTSPTTYTINAGAQGPTGTDFLMFRFTSAAGDGSLGTAVRDSLTGVPSAGGGIFIGVQILNETAAPITGFNLGYTGEQWWVRSGGQSRFDVSYSTNAASLHTGSWNEIGALQFLAPHFSASTGSIDGNATGNFQEFDPVAVTLSSALQPGETLWIRWFSPNVAGVDQSISIDNVTFSAIPEPSTYALMFGLGVLGVAGYRRFARR